MPPELAEQVDDDATWGDTLVQTVKVYLFKFLSWTATPQEAWS